VSPRQDVSIGFSTTGTPRYTVTVNRTSPPNLTAASDVAALPIRDEAADTAAFGRALQAFTIAHAHCHNPNQEASIRRVVLAVGSDMLSRSSSSPDNVDTVVACHGDMGMAMSGVESKNSTSIFARSALHSCTLHL